MERMQLFQGNKFLCLTKKRFENACSIIKSLLCSLPASKPFTKYVHEDLAKFKSPLGSPDKLLFRTRGAKSPTKATLTRPHSKQGA